LACIFVQPVNAVAVTVAVLAFAFIHIDFAGKASESVIAFALVGIYAIDTLAILIACHTKTIINVDVAIVAVETCKTLAGTAACYACSFAAIFTLPTVLASSARIRHFAVGAAPAISSAGAGVRVVAVRTGTMAGTVHV